MGRAYSTQWEKGFGRKPRSKEIGWGDMDQIDLALGHKTLGNS
jgi:hypothetical protein